MNIIHVSEAAPDEGTGMGRVALHWKRACERRGHAFVHIGPEEAGPVAHKAFFPRAAWHAWKRMNMQPGLFLVHEPASGVFVRRGVPTVAFSHGLERRGWELTLRGDEKPRLKTRLLFPLWRLRHCDAGLRRAEGVLLINREDADYAARHYGIDVSRTHIFKNGVNLTECDETQIPSGPFTVLFNGTWITRKGVRMLAQAAEILHRKGLKISWVLAGTSLPESEVLASWPDVLHEDTKVIPKFAPGDETDLLRRAHVFVLPSFYEGQPLSLLQAMEAGRCCIATNCCGQKDFIQDRVNGLLFQPGDSEALAALVAECAANESLRRSLGHAARVAARERAWEIVADETVAKIESLVGGTIA